MKWLAYVALAVCLLFLVSAFLNNMRWAYYENGKYCLDKWTGSRYAVADKTRGEYVGGGAVGGSGGLYDLTKPYGAPSDLWGPIKSAGAPSDVRIVYERPNPFLDTAKYVFGSAGILAAFGFTVRFATAWRQRRG